MSEKNINETPEENTDLVKNVIGDNLPILEETNKSAEEIKNEIVLITKSLADEASRFDAKIQSHLKDARKEVGFAVKDLEKSAGIISNKMQEQLSVFEQKLTELAEETFSLRKLPEKIEEQLNQLIPNISSEIQKKTFEGYERSLAVSEVKINSLTEKVLLATQKLADIETSEFKKRLKTFALAISISILGSGILTYFLIQQFPNKITIDGYYVRKGSNVT